MRPILDKLKKYSKDVKARFHMPGHNGCLDEIDNSLDITEVNGMDNLLFSDGIIKESENIAASIYAKKHAMYSTSRSTLCMYVALSIVKNLNLNVVAFKNMHTSFYNAAKMLEVAFIEVDNIAKLETYLKEHEASVVFITSPDYFGALNNIKEVRTIALKYKAKVFLDSAHGAHFAYSPLFENLASYADLTFFSMHKTMSALTGAAVMVMDDDKLYELALYFRSKLHSTSPSYLTLASIDYALEDFIKNGRNYYEKIKQKIDSFNNNIASFEIVKNYDFSRLVLRKPHADAYDLLKQLSEMGIEIEMAYLDMLVLIVTPYNVDKLDLLEEALKKLNIKQLKVKDIKISGVKVEHNLKEIEFINIEDATGRISASEVGIYPPSTPILKENYLIDESIIKVLLLNREHLFGIVNGKIAVLK